MRLLLNIIWFVLAGFWMAIGYALAALVMFILIITIPFGIAALRIGDLRAVAVRPDRRPARRRRAPARRSATCSGSCSPAGGSILCT